MTIDRRGFFATLAAGWAALFGRKSTTTTLSAAPVTSPTTMLVRSGWAPIEFHPVSFLVDAEGRIWQLGPGDRRCISSWADQSHFQRQLAQALDHIPTPTPDQVDHAFQEVNEMMDRWNAEDYRRKRRDGRIPS